MTPIRAILFNLILGLGLIPASGADTAPQTEDLPNFHELYSLIRTNLAGLSEADLQRAAVSGLLGQLRNQVRLMTNAPSEYRRFEGPPTNRTAVFDQTYGYVRIENVRYGLAQSVARAFDQLQSSNTLGGLVLDLRFADGDDYDEAAAVCNLFFSSEQPLLKWAGHSARSTAKTNSVTLPVMMLVNRRTSSAAEALAAVLQSSNIGLVVGDSTAGEVQVFKDFNLGDGLRVRIASGTVEVGRGNPLSADGITPDIRVRISEAAERNYLADPYGALPAPLQRLAEAPAQTQNPGVSAQNPSSSRRITESMLIRLSQEGDDDSLTEPSTATEIPPPLVVQDPTLARALDVLKGLTLIRTRR